MKKKVKYLLAILFIIVSISCNKKKKETEMYDYNYTQPTEYSDGLNTASLSDVGLQVNPLKEMMDDINNTTDHRIHNILIMKDNKLVFEEYFEGHAFSSNAPNNDGEWIQYTRETDHFLASETKSVTSVLAGIAFKEGYLTDVNQKIIDFFPEYADIFTGEKADITLKHLLTMTCGLTFDENTYPYGDPRNDVTQMIINEDPMRFILSKDLVVTPGTSFFYHSGATNLIAAIIEKATGMGLLDFANQYLFTPLNTEGGAWEAFSSGYMFASGGLWMRVRELLKIGTLMLNDGYWGATQIIEPDWIESSVYEHISTPTWPNASSYGYQWWIKNFSVNNTNHKCFYAAGWGDQYMFIIPDFDMIIVINCGNYSHQAKISPFNVVQNYIMKALEN